MENLLETPIEKIIKRPVARNLINAGFKTAGDVINASPEEIADCTYSVGLVRADKIRQEVFNALLQIIWNEGTWEIVEEPRRRVSGWKRFLISVLFAVLLAILLQTVAKAI